MKKEVQNIITIGASAGGFSAVSSLLAALPADLDAAVFVVIHLSKTSREDMVLNLLNKKSVLEVKIPENGTPIENGLVYLAPVNEHMIIEKGIITTSGGAKENHWRPAIDVLFRTAAAAYDSCVTGIILTGLLDDGTSGMVAIKAAGGICIVQEPEEAEFPDMPNNVINNMEVDYRVPLLDIAYILNDIYSRGDCKPDAVPENIKQESDITIRMASSYDATSKLGKPTVFTCPDCGGILTEIEEPGMLRYRCFTGHVFSENVLMKEYSEKTEDSLWIAIRMMEERRNFMLSMANRLGESQEIKDERINRAAVLKDTIDHLKHILQGINKIEIKK